MYLHCQRFQEVTSSMCTKICHKCPNVRCNIDCWLAAQVIGANFYINHAQIGKIDPSQFIPQSSDVCPTRSQESGACILPPARLPSNQLTVSQNCGPQPILFLGSSVYIVCLPWCVCTQRLKTISCHSSSKAVTYSEMWTNVYTNQIWTSALDTSLTDLAICSNSSFPVH